MTAIHGPLQKGFGEILLLEAHLRQQVQALRTGHLLEATPGLDRILSHHVDQLSAVQVLLEQRYQLLPCPSRFFAIEGMIRSFKDTSLVLEDRIQQRLGPLLTSNQELRLAIEGLIEISGDHDCDEASLKEAAQRHSDLEWMLSAMLSESWTKGGPPQSLDLAEGAWENEGGHPLSIGEEKPFGPPLPTIPEVPPPESQVSDRLPTWW